ncbi:hypothetical protein ACFWIO_05485 [Streptomyces diastatochromogenes]|uniref:hypothetical protein n=1 Tax=Streptomyces diastatochromogenes TaxID=42236 RepID=UPI00364C8A70
MDGPAGPDLPGGHNGLVQVQDGTAAVLTGIHTGDVDVTVTFHTTAPQPEHVQVRPAPAQDVVVLRQTDRYGDSVRER